MQICFHRKILQKWTGSFYLRNRSSLRPGKIFEAFYIFFHLCQVIVIRRKNVWSASDRENQNPFGIDFYRPQQ